MQLPQNSSQFSYIKKKFSPYIDFLNILSHSNIKLTKKLVPRSGIINFTTPYEAVQRLLESIYANNWEKFGDVCPE